MLTGNHPILFTLGIRICLLENHGRENKQLIKITPLFNPIIQWEFTGQENIFIDYDQQNPVYLNNKSSIIFKIHDTNFELIKLEAFLNSDKLKNFFTKFNRKNEKNKFKKLFVDPEGIYRQKQFLGFNEYPNIEICGKMNFNRPKKYLLKIERFGRDYCKNNGFNNKFLFELILTNKGINFVIWIVLLSKY
ncbi:unnamed protein product [Meloidogyne enterolobii]|uniref:Uncharacterized protein n=1 Tax=Meloidogyne enterolobii TaxID=390850 RepID=A0ACB1B3Y8_MELEN